MRGFDAAQRDYDAQLPPEYYEVEKECPVCDAIMKRNCMDTGWICECGEEEDDPEQDFYDID